MDYQGAIDSLLTLVDTERQPPGFPLEKEGLQGGPQPRTVYKLDRIQALLERLGQPHLAARTIHIAGTKGKGSTAALCDAACCAAGYKTGFYSSPHLHSFRERIRRDTEPIGEEHFARLVEELWPQQQWVSDNCGLGAVSLFEFMTAMAFHCYAQDHVDFQTIEVGLGGRLDATNLVRPDVCVITSLSLDHTAILGNTLGEIAAEKAGIIKPGATVVMAPQQPEAASVILSVCRQRGARAIRVGTDVTWQGGGARLDGQAVKVQGRLDSYDLWMPLLGTYQLENAANAVAALETLREQGHTISRDDIAEGFASVSWPCRLEVLSREPLVVADGAHNAYSIGAMLDSLSRYFKYRRLLLIVGFSRDKDVQSMVRLLSGFQPTVFATRSRHPRSMPPRAIADQFRSFGVEATEVDTVAGALAKATAQLQAGDMVLGTGSLFVAAEVRESLLGIKPELYPDLLPADPGVQILPP